MQFYYLLSNKTSAFSISKWYKSVYLTLLHAIIFLHTIASLVYNVVRIPPFVVKVSPNWNLKSRFQYRKGLSFLCSSKFNQMNLYMSHIHLSVGFIQKYICLFKNTFLIQLFFKSSCQKSILFS